MKKKITVMTALILALTMLISPAVYAAGTANSSSPATANAAAKTSTAKKTAAASSSKKTASKKKQKTVFIAAGHQQTGIASREQLAPGSGETKMKLTWGATGISTRIPEYKTNLAIARAVQKELKKAGYRVIMLRTTNNCPLSNKQRTQKANKSGADIHICIHTNSDDNTSVTGPLVIVPASARYVGKKIYSDSEKLGKCLISAVTAKTGKKARSTIYSNYYTTINWAKIPTVIIECGFLSNPREDRQLNSASYQKKIAQGIVKGVNNYFK